MCVLRTLAIFTLKILEKTTPLMMDTTNNVTKTSTLEMYFAKKAFDLDACDTMVLIVFREYSFPIEYEMRKGALIDNKG